MTDVEKGLCGGSSQVPPNGSAARDSQPASSSQGADGNVLVANQTGWALHAGGRTGCGGAKLGAPPGAILGARDGRVWVATNEGACSGSSLMRLERGRDPDFHDARFQSLKTDAGVTSRHLRRARGFRHGRRPFRVSPPTD